MYRLFSSYIQENPNAQASTHATAQRRMPNGVRRNKTIKLVYTAQGLKHSSFLFIFFTQVNFLKVHLI
jgi:hypothetical protein